MSKYKIKVSLLKNEGLTIAGGEPMVFHCNHYNIFLQRTIEDAASYAPVEDILTDGAAISVYSMLHRIFERDEKFRDSSSRLSIASDIYSQFGFGLLDLKTLAVDGGELSTPITHYSYAWREKWGKRDKPVDYFTCGYIQAALAAAFYKPLGAYAVKQTKCLSMGDEINVFVAEPQQKFKHMPVSPGVGTTIEGSASLNRIATNVDEQAITDAIRGIPLEGNHDGLIPAFGVYLTRHFSTYYNYISYETARHISTNTGEEELAKDLLIEAGHICAFNTLGGIMLSDEWYGLIEPQCKTREDWASGIVAVVNALGWGYWAITELDPGKSMKLQVHGSYESNGYMAMYGQSDLPRSYLVAGGVAGLMNVLYHGDIMSKPTLDEDYYNKLFRSENSFIGSSTQDRSMGDAVCEITVVPLS